MDECQFCWHDVCDHAMSFGVLYPCTVDGCTCDDLELELEEEEEEEEE